MDEIRGLKFSDFVNWDLFRISDFEFAHGILKFPAFYHTLVP